MNRKSPYKRDGMFAGANHLVFELAKDLRRNMTEAETVLWLHLKPGIKGFSFRRQHPISIYIADFYCHKLKLIVEADGLIHDRPETKDNDKLRARDLEKLGCTIIRFTNKEIMIEIENVLRRLEILVENLSQNLINNQKQKPPLGGLGV